MFERKRASRVIVTGAAGFIGSHVSQMLCEDGREVIGVDNFDPYYDPALKHRNADLIGAAGAKFDELDLRDFAVVRSLIADNEPDVVVHLAAKAGVRASVAAPHDYFQSNLAGTQNVLEACRLADVERVVLASTSSVYGETKTIPFREDDPCIRPMHPYAATKRAGELIARNYSDVYDMSVTALRFFTVYGERGRPDMMPRMLLESISHGREIPLFDGPLERDWTHVSDIARGVVAAVDHPTRFATLNLGGGRPLPLAEFISTLESVSGGKANLIPKPRPASEMMTTYASTDRLAEDLGVRPEIEVREGISRMWEWWQRELRNHQ